MHNNSTIVVVHINNTNNSSNNHTHTTNDNDNDNDDDNNKHHNEARKVGYQYFADQQTGTYTQWPLQQFCITDPRQRPWYAAGATGPKDVVIVVVRERGSASVQWQPDGLTIHAKKWFLGAGFLGAPPISLRSTCPAAC